jgi:hypothetical protein
MVAERAMEIVRKNPMVSIEPSSFHEAEALAIKMSESSVMPDALRGKPADILAIGLMGRDLNLSFMQSLRGIYVIKGRPYISADLLVSLVLSSGAAEYFTCMESTAQIARFRTHRHGDPSPIEMSFTIEQAKRAALATKDIWRDNPEDMLRHRCSAKLARMVYPDVVMGNYVPEEAGSFESKDVATVILSGPSQPEPEQSAESKAIAKMSVDKVVAVCVKRGVTEALALEYCEGDKDALVQLARALKAGSITPAQVAESVAKKGAEMKPEEKPSDEPKTDDDITL